MANNYINSFASATGKITSCVFGFHNTSLPSFSHWLRIFSQGENKNKYYEFSMTFPCFYTNCVQIKCAFTLPFHFIHDGFTYIFSTAKISLNMSTYNEKLK